MTFRMMALNGLMILPGLTALACIKNDDGVLRDTPVPTEAVAPPPPADWIRVARIGGASVDPEDEDNFLKGTLSVLVEQNVSVVEADSNLSDYLDDQAFDAELSLMERFSRFAHDRNLKVVWYYPSFETITPGGENSAHSMFKDHPDWVQTSHDDTPNVFYGSKVFWVDPGAESAWMCHLSPYRDYYMQRVQRMASTGIDGLWLDVPLFNDIVGRWACHRPEDRAKFKADTGYDIPKDPNPDDPAWKVWVHWRHTEIDAFLKEVLARAREVDPDFYLVVETVTMDYNAALLEGLDGAFAGPVDGLWHVWEVDVLSDTDSMVNATDDDWISLIAMLKFGRGADRDRAAWTFVYGDQPDDAEAVMAEALSAQCNPYELKVPEMTTTVGSDYRTRVFGWIRANEDALFRTESGARVGLVHSSASRDYVDGRCILDEEAERHCGVSLYARWERPLPWMEWWTTDKDDSVYNSNYMAEYRGLVKALVHLHVPFDILPSRLLTPEVAARYSMLVLPDLRAVSDAEVNIITDFAEKGGALLFTGPGPGVMDERGLDRSKPAFKGLAAVGTRSGKCASTVVGKGESTWCAFTAGRDYLVGSDPKALDAVRTAVEEGAPPVVKTDADRQVHLSLYSSPGRRVLHAVNFTGMDGAFKVEPTTFHVSVNVGPGFQAGSVSVTSARMNGGPESLAFTQDGEWVAFDASVEIYSMFIIRKKTVGQQAQP
ncbi:MAG: family 10 glycosylhydrolase [Deltaproteobacteria bacterium]|nr:family 10 glycosylhydrolase [Deltaproteobacteria bacterium]